MSQGSSLDAELAKRLANQFIFSAVIAFVVYYRIEIYSVITNQPNWQTSLENMSFWNSGYLGEIIAVILIYLSAILFGSIINYFKVMVSKFGDSWLEKYQLVSLSESHGLHKMILNLENKIEELKQQVVNRESITHQRTDSFMKGLKFKGLGEVVYLYTEESTRNSKPSVYSNITNSYPNKNVFDALENGEVIRFFNHFALGDRAFLVYEFKYKNLSGVCLGHEILFRQIIPGIDNSWDVLYFSEKSTSWTVENPGLKKRYFKLVKEKDGSIFLHAIFR